MKQPLQNILDYQIISNNDGIVLTKPDGQLFECNLGYYSTLRDARIAAVRHFMISRPSIFAKVIAARLDGFYCYQEFYLFKNTVEKLGLTMPDELSPSTCGNYTLTFSGERI